MWAYVAVCVALLLSMSRAATVNLQAYITFSLLTSNGSSPLADGSVVYIIGSKDSVENSMLTYGSPPTNYLANSVSGDDILIAAITVQSSQLNSNGTFYAGDYYYDDALVDYLYIRFFDGPATPTGMVNWGTSPMTNVGDLFDCCGLGVIEVDFVGNLSTTNRSNFVVIPEPSSANLAALCIVMFAALGAYSRRVKRATSDPYASSASFRKEEP